MGTFLGSIPKLQKKIECQKFSIEWCSRKTFVKKKICSHIVKNIIEILQVAFKRFLMTISSVISNLVKFCPEKNLTSNGPKPIRVQTRTKFLCSGKRLPIGYLLPDFQPHRSNFFIHSLHFTSSITRKKGVGTRGDFSPIYQITSS